MNQDLILDKLTNNIIDYTIITREKVYNNVREEMVNYYWNVGRMIVEEEQEGNITPEYGRKLYLELAKRLTKKMGKLKPENMGQMNMYLNYYETEINDIEDNKPIGIILCAKKDNVVAEYSLGGINNNLFASNYTYFMPNKEELIAQVEKVIKENEEEKE